MTNRLLAVAGAVVVLAAVPLAVVRTGSPGARAEAAEAPADTRVFELRTYTAAPGKLDALNARFRDHTVKLFEKHGMTNIGYWMTTDPKDEQPKLVYLLAHQSRAAAAASWKAFQADPEWQKARADSEKDGKLLAKPPEAVYLTPTDYSRLK